ncbi:MAG: allose kinase [Eubacteriales bacterium]|nr:allose kinase [Eubacteriales bacterium]
MAESCVIGIDIGGTNFRIGAVNEHAEVLRFQKIPVGTVFHTPDAMEDLRRYMTGYVEELRAQGLKPLATAIGFPATIDRERTYVMQAPNVAFMENLPVVKVLTEALGMPVFIERDVTMALYYDVKKYEIPDCEVLIGCYFGTGIGNAIQIFGRPLLGRNGAAGELGHIPVDGSERECGCGNRGCMESLAGGKYLAALCREVYQDTHVGDIFEKHGDEELLLQFIDRMACAVASEVNILDPDYVIIGGGVTSMKKFPTERLLERLKVHARKPLPAGNLRVVMVEDAEEKGAVGAAFYAYQCLKNAR